MIYIKIPESNKDTANQWVIENADPQGMNTFVANRQDNRGRKFCLISLPDNGTDYTEKMKEHFGTIDNLVGLEDIPE